MKTLAIGDVHGRDYWKEVVDQEFDKVIFIGDYWDSWDIKFPKQHTNFQQIIQFKKDNPDRVVLLIGNHDFHYFKGVDETYSGFQTGPHVTIRQEMEDNLDLFDLIHEDGEYLFSHAGISKTWVRNKGFTSLKEINPWFKENYRRAGWEEGKYRDPYGDDVEQGPLWIRPHSLLSDKYGNYFQVVGHTTYKDITYNDGVYFIDAIGKYLTIQDGKAT